MESDQRQASPGIRRWIPIAGIIAASALAHLWCLKSQFYMDDITGILENPAVLEGAVFDAGILNFWTVLGYVVQYKLFGMSSVGFHAVNWLLHTAAACVLFGFGRDFLKGRMTSGVAWFGALLFAVHPLGSEIPNYARTQDLAWVTLFSLLASWAMLAWMRGGGWKCLAAVAVAGMLAAMSKGPGMFHAAMMVGAVALAFVGSERIAWLKRRLWWGVAAVGVALVVFWSTGLFTKFLSATELWKEPRFVGHGFTLARVFWEFAWRALVPIALCSDHQIAETMIPRSGVWFDLPDRVAMLSALAMLVLTAFSLWLSWNRRTRLFGVCLFLFTATMLFRVLYLIPEFMPEYRIYPGLPWFCLGAAILAGALWKTLPGGGSPAWLAALVVGVFIVLSAKRSFVWHDMDRLCTDVLKQYPAQARAVWELHDRDMAGENWQGIISRQQSLWPQVFKSFMDQNKKLAPARDLNSGHFAMADVACHGRYAIALAHVKGPRAGVMEIKQLEAKITQLGITKENNAVTCGIFHHARATVMEMAGAYPQALESMRMGASKVTPADIKRVERKISETKR
jgi:hypothetical protein